jgi:hypothetical protein
MQYVRAQFALNEATERLTRTRFSGIRRVLGIGLPPALRVELIYLPHYAITIPVYQGESKSTACAAIEACSGAFSLRRYKQELISDQPQDTGQVFTPQITEAEALEIAQDGILRNALRERGGRRTFKWAEPESVHLLLHPFWVYYYARRRGLLDIRLLDAVTGDRPGSKTKGGVLDAFVDAGRENQRNQVEHHSS